jgi:putative SOS response-associated peptidase YedK
MCGRYSITTPAEAMRQLFDLKGPLPNYPPRYNVAPSQDAPVVRLADGSRELTLMRWGLIPSWSQGPDSKFSMINARAETVAEKPAYRSAFKSRRCLVPADGFFEWHAEGKKKQPFFIHMKDERVFAFAGLWERWDKGAEPITSFTIIVTEANALLKQIHERMPVILGEDDYAAWLDPGAPPDAARALLRPYDPERMAFRKISTRVNSPKNDDPEVLAPLGASA